MANWHRWVGEDDELVRCLICGGLWSVREYPRGEYRYTSIGGEEATVCSLSTDQCHHYLGECPRTVGESCNRMDCNCLSCRS